MTTSYIVVDHVLRIWNNEYIIHGFWIWFYYLKKNDRLITSYIIVEHGFDIHNDDYIINHLKFKVLVHEYEGSGVEIIGTGEEGMGVISEADKKKASSFEIVGFEVESCSVKYDPEVMSKRHMYDKIAPVACPSELHKSQIIREQERVSFT